MVTLDEDGFWRSFKVMIAFFPTLLAGGPAYTGKIVMESYIELVRKAIVQEINLWIVVVEALIAFYWKRNKNVSISRKQII